MSRKTFTQVTHGSQKDIQLLANKYKKLLDEEISKIKKETVELEWFSPLKDDDYAEYADQCFIDRLGISDRILVQLKDFWPEPGANWDGLAKDGETVFIMEAKAHISEINIDSTRASSGKSLELIEKSLNETKEFLNIKSDISWCKENYYQYANRIAHLYYLREKNKIDAHLLFIYFLNDKSVVTGKKEETKEDWEKEINGIYNKLELKENNKLSKFIHHIFIDVESLKK